MVCHATEFLFIKFTIFSPLFIIVPRLISKTDLVTQILKLFYPIINTKIKKGSYTTIYLENHSLFLW